MGKVKKTISHSTLIANAHRWKIPSLLISLPIQLCINLSEIKSLPFDVKNINY